MASKYLTASAATFLGVSWPSDDLFRQYDKRVRGCDHELPRSGEACNQCGRPDYFVQTVSTCRLGGREILQQEQWEGPVTGELWDLRVTLDEENVLIGRGVTISNPSDEPERMDLTDLDELYNLLKADLTSVGLWDEDLWGVWCAQCRDE